jgi:hypothetical protein
MLWKNGHFPKLQISSRPWCCRIGYDETLVIPGWDIKGLSGNMFAHNYGSDFGQTGVANASKYSTLKFSLQLERDITLFHTMENG